MREQILIVDDSAGTRDSLAAILGDEGYRPVAVGSAAETRQALGRQRFDLVFLDLKLPDAHGLELLEELVPAHVDLPIVVISGQGNIDLAVGATRLGAYDFLEKPLSLQRVVVTAQNALDRVRMQRTLDQLSSSIEASRELIGDSAPMRKLKADLARAAASDSRILIFGDNGTGKELAARQAHSRSQRAPEPFVEVNCAAIPEELIESELFGHVKGSFTGASEDRAGRFEQADGGTLFLDEIADMSLKTQAKVLRALQEQRFERVGGKASIQVDVRVIAATNKDLQEEIAAGRFREDLYFRLAVIPLHMPPLRERTDDLPALVEHFIALCARDQGRRPKHVPDATMSLLRRYRWPGNVRELRNFIERMMIMVPGDEILPRDLPPQLRSPSVEQPLATLEAHDQATLRQARAAFERQLIERRLELCGGNVSRAASQLGIERSHLHRKMTALGIRRREPANAPTVTSPRD